MADLGFKFNSSEIADSKFEPLPEGEYVGMFTESKMKDTKSGDGQYIEMRFEIVEGQYAGRILFERLNIKNKNEQAVEIAYQNLKQICECVNKTTIQNTEELHNIRLIAQVKIDGDYNRIKKYKSMKEKLAPASSSTDGAAKKPWQK